MLKDGRPTVEVIKEFQIPEAAISLPSTTRSESAELLNSFPTRTLRFPQIKGSHPAHAVRIWEIGQK